MCFPSNGWSMNWGDFSFLQKSHADELFVFFFSFFFFWLSLIMTTLVMQ